MTTERVPRPMSLLTMWAAIAAIVVPPATLVAAWSVGLI
jgi:hypothetical protein